MDRQRRFTWINSNHVGFTDENLIGKTLFDIFSEKDAHRLDALYSAVMERGFRAAPRRGSAEPEPVELASTCIFRPNPCATRREKLSGSSPPRPT